MLLDKLGIQVLRELTLGAISPDSVWNSKSLKSYPRYLMMRSRCIALQKRVAQSLGRNPY